MATGIGNESVFYSPTQEGNANATDQSGNGNNGSQKDGTNLVSFVSDTDNGGSGAYSLSGLTSQGIETGLVPIADGNWAFACWIKPDLGSSSNQIAMSTDVGAGTRDDAVIKLDSSGRYFGKVGTRNQVGSVDLRGDWHHVAMMYRDASKAISYWVDGRSAGFDTGSSGYFNTNLFQWVVGNSGGSSAVSWSGLIDDVRVWNDDFTSQMDIAYLATSRGITGPRDYIDLTFRKTQGFVLDRAGHSPCASDNVAYNAFNYDSVQGFGWVSGGSMSGSKTRDRDASAPPELAGIHFSSTDGDQFRVDLPKGAGKYRISCTHGDPSFAGNTGWVYRDGSAGTDIATISASHGIGEYVDIDDSVHSVSSYDPNSHADVEHTFTNSFMTVNRDTSVSGGAGNICSICVKHIPDTPPPTTGFYNPFNAYTDIYDPFKARRIR